MKIFHYNEFLINESLVTLADNLVYRLMNISNLLPNKDKEWVDKIIGKSNRDISSDKLDDKNDYYFDLTDDPKYLDMKITKPNSSSTQKFKVGRALKTMVPDIPTDILSNIVSALQSASDFEIKIVEGDDIGFYYNYNDISAEGTLGKSCMNEMGDEIFNFYSENKDVVKLAILLDEDEMLIARALLWKTNIGWVMDRVYYASDKYGYQFKDWAKSNNYLISYELESSKSDVKIQLNESDFDKYPYLDTFNCICFNRSELSNDDIFYTEDEVAMLDSVDGSFTPIRNVKLPFEHINNLSDYKWANSLSTFINYSIDYDKWLSDFIDEEFEQFYSYPKEFLDVYDYYIERNFHKLRLEEIDEQINIDNFKEMILGFHENYMSKYEDIIRKVIELRYSKEEGFESWMDWHDEIYGDDIGSYQSLSKREKEHFDRFISNYCELEILNGNLEEIYRSNYDNYERVIYKVLG